MGSLLDLVREDIRLGQMVSLCRACHERANGRREMYESYLRSLYEGDGAIRREDKK